MKKKVMLGDVQWERALQIHRRMQAEMLRADDAVRRDGFQILKDREREGIERDIALN